MVVLSNQRAEGGSVTTPCSFLERTVLPSHDDFHVLQTVQVPICIPICEKCAANVGADWWAVVVEQPDAHSGDCFDPVGPDECAEVI